MGELTMEEYMTKTREDYGSRIVRPKIDDKARFELKGQFLKELRDNTFSGSDNEDANKHIEKVNEKVYAAQVGCESCKGPHYTKDCPLKEKVKAFEEAFYTQQTIEESMNKFMAESAKRHDENSILIKEIRSLTNAAIQNQGASIKDLEIQIRQMSKLLQERGSGSLPCSTETNLRDHVKSISTTIETDTTSIRRIGGA
ncbi:hypothetical protein Tco_0115517 [Tanacetum coccineum]